MNIPKCYSVETAEVMLKSYTTKKKNIFEIVLEFRKRCPRGGFWSGYDHCESAGWKKPRRV
jgi:hypothetical protein